MTREAVDLESWPCCSRNKALVTVLVLCSHSICIWAKLGSPEIRQLMLSVRLQLLCRVYLITQQKASLRTISFLLPWVLQYVVLLWNWVSESAQGSEDAEAELSTL